MKLNELNLDGYKHIKNNDWKLPKNLADWLYENNFEKIGRGLFSSVFASQTENFVVKVNRGNIDESYIKFVEFCQKNNSPHLPKMGKIKKYDNFYIIFVEKLKPMEDFFGMGEMSTWKFFNYCIDIINSTNDDEFKKEKIKEAFNKRTNYSLNENILEQIFEISFLMSKFLKELPDRNMLDLHSGNIMLRGNNLVVIDP